MKKLFVAIAVLAMAPLAAQTIQIIGTIKNNGGGNITLTGIRGTCAEGKLVAYTQLSGGKIVAFGCFYFFGDQAVIEWDDGDRYTYDARSVQFTEEFLRRMGGTKS